MRAKLTRPRERNQFGKKSDNVSTAQNPGGQKQPLLRHLLKEKYGTKELVRGQLQAGKA